MSRVSPIIYIFCDRIEIVSSGALPNGLTLDGFYEGYSKPRNPELMIMLRDLEYVEQSGYGINKIIEIYGKDVFVVIDNFIKMQDKLSKFQYKIIIGIIDNNRIAIKSCQKYLAQAKGVFPII